MICPFCKEEDFDEIGLKGHLLSDCEIFSKTQISPRLFQDSLLFESIRSEEEILRIKEENEQ